MRQLTEEQKAKSAERKARFREIAKRVAAMSDIEKAQMTQRIGAVVTCEGRALSLHNTLMLMLQIENVSMVGGFRQWLKAGRAVRKGEHGAMIWIRTGKKAEEPASEPVDDSDHRFLMGTVFDVSQTVEVQSGEGA